MSSSPLHAPRRHTHVHPFLEAVGGRGNPPPSTPRTPAESKASWKSFLLTQGKPFKLNFRLAFPCLINMRCQTKCFGCFSLCPTAMPGVWQFLVPNLQRELGAKMYYSEVQVCAQELSPGLGGFCSPLGRKRLHL